MINVNELKDFLGCDDAFIYQLMEKFIQETKEGVDRLNTASREKEWHTVKLVAHKMLSSTRIFKFDQMNEILEKIEVMAENKVNLEKIPELIREFESAWRQAIEEMNSMILSSR
jgi:HPt (histidine-containing phosphotransfer) domain-containing protein